MRIDPDDNKSTLDKRALALQPVQGWRRWMIISFVVVAGLIWSFLGTAVRSYSYQVAGGNLPVGIIISLLAVFCGACYARGAAGRIGHFLYVGAFGLGALYLYFGAVAHWVGRGVDLTWIWPGLAVMILPWLKPRLGDKSMRASVKTTSETDLKEK